MLQEGRVLTGICHFYFCFGVNLVDLGKKVDSVHLLAIYIVHTLIWENLLAPRQLDSGVVIQQKQKSMELKNDQTFRMI